MTDLQICIAALFKMPWLIIVPIAMIATGLSEAINKEWDGRFK